MYKNINKIIIMIALVAGFALQGPIVARSSEAFHAAPLQNPYLAWVNTLFSGSKKLICNNPWKSGLFGLFGVGLCAAGLAYKFNWWPFIKKEEKKEEKEYQEFLKEMQRRGIVVPEIGKTDKEGKSILHFIVIYSDNSKLINYAISKVANANIKDNLNYTPLYYAIKANKIGMVKSLLPHAKNINEFYVLPSNSGLTQVSYLMLASLCGNDEICKLLINREDVDVNESASNSNVHMGMKNFLNCANATAIVLATLYGYYKIVKMLLDKDSKSPKKYRWGNGKNLLHCVVCGYHFYYEKLSSESRLSEIEEVNYRYVKTMQLLLKFFDPESPDLKKQTPLIWIENNTSPYALLTLLKSPNMKTVLEDVLAFHAKMRQEIGSFKHASPNWKRISELENKKHTVKTDDEVEEYKKLQCDQDAYIKNCVRIFCYDQKKRSEVSVFSEN